MCSCSAGVHVRFPSVAQASTCRADVSLLGASPQGSRPPRASSSRSVQLDAEFVQPRVWGRSPRPPSKSQLTGPKFFHPSVLDPPADCKSGRVCREPVASFLEQHGSSYLQGTPSWSGMLNLSAYKALHPTWNQEPDLLRLAEGLEEHCPEGTLEYWTLHKSVEATEIQDHSSETWARIARASEDLVHSVSKGTSRVFKFVSANVTSWRPEVRQWMVSQQFDVALIQEHHLSEQAFQAESVALSKAGYHLHGRHAPARKREVGGVMVCVRSHLQARHLHTFQDPETGCGFVAIAVRITGFDLVLFSLYLETGGDFEGQVNASVLSNLHAVIASLKCPWCVVGDWNLDASDVLATRLEDITKGRMLGTGMPTAGTSAELDYALLHPRLASHVSLELMWDVPFKPHAALLCTLPLKPLQDFQPIVQTIADNFEPISDELRTLAPSVVSPQRVSLIEIEARDSASLAFAQFSATAEASGMLGTTKGRGVDLQTTWKPVVSQAPDAYQWFGHEHAVWSQLAVKFKAGGPERVILSLLSKLGLEHQEWVGKARDIVLNHGGESTQPSQAAHDDYQVCGLSALQSHAEEQAKLAKKVQHAKDTDSYQQWLAGALSAGMGPLYRALKSHEQTLARPFRDQAALARSYCRLEFWGHIWNASIIPPQRDFTEERLALRAEASKQAQALPPLSAEQVKIACLATGNKKGGLDGWTFRALRNIPDSSYQQLAELFRLFEVELSLPIQMQAVQVVLLAKSPEKERPISLTSVLWRVYSKMRRPLLESWLREYAAFAPFDAATPGHTSLDPALSRLVKAEDHKFRKITFITLFVDLEGFYDGVDFSRLLAQGKALQFPPLLLELSLQVYAGPRSIHSEGVSTLALWPQKGLCAGCPYAPTVAKLTTHAPLQGISQHPGVSHADLWLDDISVDISHADPEVAASLALSAARKLEDLLSVEKLSINKTKTKFVVNNTKAAKALNTMRGEGDPQVTDLVRDLGVDSAGAKRRRVTQALKRFKMGRARNQKLHRLGTGGKAHRLYATSILTAEIYGHQGQGLSPKRLKVVRASISRHVGRSKWGSVDVTLDCMSFRCQDPLLTVVLAQADALYKMFGPSTAQGWAILARTWKVAWARQEAAVHGWKCVAGPVAAMVQYCLDLHINVQDPLRWVHSSGVLVLDVSNPGLFLSVRRFLTKVVALERAARFGAVHTAKGAQEGVDWSVHRKLLKVSKLPSPKWAFHAVWQGRILHAGNGGLSRCACGAENSLTHVYYECPLSPAKLSPAIRSFQKKHQDLPCLWLRGMVPKAWTTPQVPASALQTRVTGAFCSQPVDVTGLVIGTDASGGPNTRDPRLRAVGWSVVLCKRTEDRLVELGSISGLLPPGSTVPQGESLAIIHALMATTGVMDLTCDCKPAVHALSAKTMCTKHIPEWGQVWHDRTRVQPHWVRSHCTPEAFEKEFPSQQWRRELNDKADKLAGARAAPACSPHFVRKVKELDQVVWEVNCFLASRAEKLIKDKSQTFVPRAVRETLSQFDKPKPHSKALYANKRSFLLQLVEKSEHGHSWKVSSPAGAANLQLTCETCKLWVQQTYSQEDFHKVVTHPCVGFSDEGPKHWPLLHSTHVLRTTGKAWACVGCKQVVGVTCKSLKKALQLPCKSTGRQVSLNFASSSQGDRTAAQPARVSPPAVSVTRQVALAPPVGPGPSAEATRSATAQQSQVKTVPRLGAAGSQLTFLASASEGAAAKPLPKPRSKPKAKPKPLEPSQRTLRF